jgi:hypothetical protein
MKNFLLDLWHDLRAKRLWPVALVLLAGLVAVPVVLSKKAEPVAAPPPPPAEAEAPEPEGPARLAEVKLEELAEGTGSSLSAFNDPSNPFAPPRKVLDRLEKKADGDGGGSAGDAGGNGGGSGGGGGDTTVDGGSLGGGAGSGSGGGTSTGGAPTGDTGTPDAGDDGDSGGDGGGETTTKNFTYVVDVSFRDNNRRRKIEAMQKLDILPNPASPLLIFLGVTPDAGNAVFLVDSTLQAAGEGRCKPSNSECAFLYLGPGSEHEFTNDEGDSYTLRVDEIRRVELDRGKARASKKDKKKVASAAVGQPAPARRFSLPLLADLVSVSSGQGHNSNSGQDRR